MSGTLILLPAPLATGPLDNVLPAATLEAARSTRYFLAERAKTARAFLKQAGHPAPLRELSIVEIGHAPDPRQIDEWLAPLTAGHDVAVVAEAGCPGVADPGATLVAAAHRAGMRVNPLVGPSSILLALMGSGLNGQQFRFVGYLPTAADARTAAVQGLERESRRRNETQIIIETPYRSCALLAALLGACAPATRLTIASDLTGTDPYLRTMTVSQWRSQQTAVSAACDGRPTVFCLLA